MSAREVPELPPGWAWDEGEKRSHHAIGPNGAEVWNYDAAYAATMAWAHYGRAAYARPPQREARELLEELVSLLRIAAGDAGLSAADYEAIERADAYLARPVASTKEALMAATINALPPRLGEAAQAQRERLADGEAEEWREHTVAGEGAGIRWDEVQTDMHYTGELVARKIAAGRAERDAAIAERDALALDLRDARAELARIREAALACVTASGSCSHELYDELENLERALSPEPPTEAEKGEGKS